MGSTSAMTTTTTTMAVAISVIAILCLFSASQVHAQGGSGEIPSCANGLVPCADYLNATNPPSSCCKPLGDAIKTQLPCLCNLFNQRGLLKTFQINITDALTLPSRCKIPGVTGNLCSSSPTSAPTASPTTPSSSTSNSSTSTSSPSTKDKNAADSIPWSRVTSLLLFIAPLMMLY